jgi:hypothetical protein
MRTNKYKIGNYANKATKLFTEKIFVQNTPTFLHIFFWGVKGTVDPVYE